MRCSVRRLSFVMFYRIGIHYAISSLSETNVHAINLHNSSLALQTLTKDHMASLVCFFRLSLAPGRQGCTTTYLQTTQQHMWWEHFTNKHHFLQVAQANLSQTHTACVKGIQPHPP